MPQATSHGFNPCPQFKVKVCGSTKGYLASEDFLSCALGTWVQTDKLEEAEGKKDTQMRACHENGEADSEAGCVNFCGLNTASTLRMPLVLPNGRPKGLHVAEEGALDCCCCSSNSTTVQVLCSSIDVELQ